MNQRRSDEYRWRQVMITAALFIALGSAVFIVALWLKPDAAPVGLVVGFGGAVIFGMCTWYASAYDPE